MNPNFYFKQAMKCALLIVLLFSLVQCNQAKKDQKPEPETQEQELVETENVIAITSQGMDIQMPDTIQAGWQTFRYSNESPDTHFILFDKYPEGKTIKDAETDVGPAFQNGMNFLMEGKNDEAMAAFGTLPEWFFGVVFSGGIGLISPDQTATTTFKLDPGYYVIECYVKMANGMFHTSMGMVTELIVVEGGESELVKESTVNLNISFDEGITYDGEIKGGKQTFAVTFIDQKPHEHFVGHDVNLVKIHEGADMSVLENWMNWMLPEGLVSPAPEGFTFLGGINDMPAGNKAYFEADLAPGNYAFISEVPNASQKNMLRPFTIE